MARLRKFLKTRRLTSIAQIGTDRIIELQFGDGQYRLFLEFFAGGNIILTDRELEIIALLRTVDEETEKVRVGIKYSLNNRQNFGGIPALTVDRVRAALEKAAEKPDEIAEVFQKRPKRKPVDALRRALTLSLNEFPPLLLEHILQVTNFDTNITVEAILKDQSRLDGLVLALSKAKGIIDGITSHEVCNGYIIARFAKDAPTPIFNEARGDTKTSRENLIYEDFQPFQPQKFAHNPEISILEVNGFNKAVDEFFSCIESQKLESRLFDREEHAKKKLTSARLDHEARLGGLQQVQGINVRKAQAIEANVQRVEEAIAAINGLLAQGMDWMDVARLIEMEQARHNAVAEMIKLPLKLHENAATLLLTEATFEDDAEYDGDETENDASTSGDEEHAAVVRVTKTSKPIDKPLAVEVDLALSPWSNARQYYDQKKSAAVKEQKTIQSSEKALKSTEKKINADLKIRLKQEKEVMRPQRKALWFEKFLYFISSEGYLVVGGKDAQQNGESYFHQSIFLSPSPDLAMDLLLPIGASTGYRRLRAGTEWCQQGIERK